ncbi:MAG: outer membrane beta-barrel protein [Deltaproteobacteria bacterium]|nr:outer membrane beta-barrel protein [Deltaproteobacteria bacterium]
MKKIFFVSQALFLLTLTSTFAEDRFGNKRTDGKPGSEWSDFDKLFDGQFQVGAHFGTILPTNSSDGTFAVGADADYRPYELFGIRLTGLQGLSSPKATMITVTPLVHTQISNFFPYAMIGPGIAITNYGKTRTKFDISAGIGTDIELTRRFQFGMMWLYNSVLDSADSHSLTARASYTF